MQILKCLTCISEGKLAAAEGNGHGVLVQPVAEDAVTLVPMWQMQQIGPQQMWACVAVPVCYGHIQVQRKSLLDTGGVLMTPER